MTKRTNNTDHRHSINDKTMTTKTFTTNVTHEMIRALQCNATSDWSVIS